MRKVVVYMGDQRIYYMMSPAAKSLLSHTSVDRVFFLIDTPAFPEPLPNIITTINVHNQSIFPVPGPNYHPHYGYMTWMRAALTKILHEESCVLLLDPDTIVTDDISPVWDYDISNYYFAAVPETRNHNHTKTPYFNAGVMLLNLDLMRRHAIDDTIIRTINSHHYLHLEQDVMNFVCDKNILPLPSDYNASFVSDPTSTPRIRHFLSFDKKYWAQFAQPYITTPWNNITSKGE